jgi:hypothetical protein
MKQIEIFTAFWGEDHCHWFHETMMPSLELPSNLPALRAAGYEIEHRVYTTTAEASRVPPHCVIDTSILTPHQDKRAHCYLAIQDSIKRGKLTIFASCDFVFSHGLARAITGLCPGELLVAGHPRIDSELCDSLLPAFLKSEAELGYDGNRRFVNFFMDTVPHPMVNHGKSNPEPYWRTSRKSTHWETFFKEPAPIGFWGSEEMLGAWPSAVGPQEAIDHDMVDMLLRVGKVRWISDSRDLIWGERTSNRRYVPTIKNEIWMDSCRHFDKEPLRWYF